MRPWLDPSFSSICIREWGGFFTLANKDRAVCCASILKTRWGRKIFMHALNCLSEGWPQRTDSQMLWTWSPCAPCTPRGLWALDIVAWEPTVPKPGSYLWKKLDLSSFSLSLSLKHMHTLRSVCKDYIIHTSTMCWSLILWLLSVCLHGLNHMCGWRASVHSPKFHRKTMLGKMW